MLEIIGKTPIYKLKVFSTTSQEIYAKLEFYNPAGSVKDRIALYMIEAAEKEGILRKGSYIVEPTSGNTGLGLALISNLKGYRFIAVMPDKVSIEKRNLLRSYGAEVVICPTNVPPDDPNSYYSVSRRIAKEKDAFYPNQYENPNNPKAHYETTGPEIWYQMNGKIDAFFAGVGTGGTISGVGKFLKNMNSKIKVVGIDPDGSILYDYFYKKEITQARVYDIEGIGEDFIPKTLDFSVIDDFVKVYDKEAFKITLDILRYEGLFVGISSGAALAGVLKYLKLHPEIKRSVVIFPDGGSRYLSKAFNEEWLKERGYL
ncbi:MAG: cysteine synthase family protein [candidate division WOR-3 bacterium]|nr:cysteine synthase family protein [candidate division WOR-3 bacterium]MCX7948314.1 cysteine synthase family protein [candidate division WOR-3 bacterium]MDW8151140.1 cysteine synthase family protein [candidate division WOR-3 bacterium]